jgi:hypothetical protein
MLTPLDRNPHKALGISTATTTTTGAQRLLCSPLLHRESKNKAVIPYHKATQAKKNKKK